VNPTITISGRSKIAAFYPKKSGEVATKSDLILPLLEAGCLPLEEHML